MRKSIFLSASIPDPQRDARTNSRDMDRAVLEILRTIAETGRLPNGLSGFCDALSDQRSFRAPNQEINSTRLSFLRGYAPAEPGGISTQRVDLLLDEADVTTGAGAESFAGRLSRLWLALRELAQLPRDAIDAELALRWIRLCELWTNSAAWLRLHGPLELGVLATLHTRVDLREAGLLAEHRFPYGAFASEAYSIAQVSDRLEWQRLRFEAARQLATKQIQSATDPSGAYGIRASASMQLALRGRRWLAGAGLLDYRKMLSTRERIGSCESEIGEALVELAYAEFEIGRRMAWSRNRALRRMREGVRMLEVDAPSLRAGFVRRGKLKLAESLQKAGLVDEAAQQHREIEALSRAHGLPLN